MIQSDYFYDAVKLQHKEIGNSMHVKNADFIFEEMNNDSSEFIQKITLANMEKGKFYFLFYNLSSKLSKMEKFNPLMVIDWFDMNSTRYLFGVNLNFIPNNIRIIFFNNLLNYNLNVIEKNSTLKLNDEVSLESINFYNIYKLLKSIGFEWSIRKYDMKLINTTYNISSKILPQFITMNSYKFTGVDDNKLIQIWQKKISEQQQRENKMIKELTLDYKNMEKELIKNYSTVSESANNLEKSLNIIKNNF